MATHSSTLAWKIPGTEEPGGLKSMGSQRVGYNWATNTSLHFTSVAHLHLGCFFLLLFSRWVVPDSLQPLGLQHARLPCPPLSPRVCSDSCLLSPWYHVTISSSATLFCFFLPSFPASGSWRRKWQPTLVVLPGEPHGMKSMKRHLG